MRKILKETKRVLSLMLVFSLILSIAAVTAAAAETDITAYVIQDKDGSYVAFDIAVLQEQLADEEVTQLEGVLLAAYRAAAEGKAYPDVVGYVLTNGLYVDAQALMDRFTEVWLANEGEANAAAIARAAALAVTTPMFGGAGGTVYTTDPVTGVRSAEGITIGTDGLPTEEPIEVTVIKAEMINSTEISVTFSANIAAGSVYANKSNYTVSSGSIESVQISGDRSVNITVKGLAYGDTFMLTAAEPVFTAQLTIPRFDELYDIILETDADGNTIASNGAETMMITARIHDKVSGQDVEQDGQIAFSVTAGALGQSIVSMQEGSASVQLTSNTSTAPVECIVTATVDSAPQNSKFVGLTGKLVVYFTPDGTPSDVLTMVKAVEVGANQGDRFFVKFSGDIPVTALNKAAIINAVRYVPYRSGAEYQIAVKDAFNFGSTDTIMFILDTDPDYEPPIFVPPLILPNTTILDENYRGVGTGKNYLRDNATHGITFRTVERFIYGGDTLEFIITDVSRPWAAGVKAISNMELEIRFSEPMADDLMLDMEFRDEYFINEHISIDGKHLLVIPKMFVDEDTVTYAENNNLIVVTDLRVGAYDEITGVDNRNITSIKIYKDHRLEPGSHGIQISGVGDWAGMVDRTQNRIETQTFTFTVLEDTNFPVAWVTVQSPEQWLIEFSRPVETSTGATLADAIEITTVEFPIFGPDIVFAQGGNVFENDYVITGYIDLFGRLIDSGFGYLDPNAPLPFAVKGLLVEFNRDWTVRLFGRGADSNNYWKSRISPFVVNFSELESETGLGILTQFVNVTTNLDEKSPEIANIPENFGDAVFVTMTEPVQLVDLVGEITLPITASITQDPNAGLQHNNSNGIQVPVYRFVNVANDDIVVYGDVGFVDEDDMSFVVIPRTALIPGEWILYIESISDDHGNTSATDSYQFTVVPDRPIDPDDVLPYIEWAAFDAASVYDTAHYDYIFIKFSVEMEAQGSARGVDRTENYKFMGQALPTGSAIYRGIEGETDNWDGVTIRMPAGTWQSNNASYTTVLSVASNFAQAGTGIKLLAPNQVELTHVGFNRQMDANGLTNPILFEAFYHNEGFHPTPQIIAVNAPEVEATANSIMGMSEDRVYVIQIGTSFYPVVLNVTRAGGMLGDKICTGDPVADLATAKALAEPGVTYLTGLVNAYTYVVYGFDVENIIPVDSITLQGTLSLEVGEKATLTATILPDNATSKTVTWSSSDETVATVVGGVVTAASAGKTTITATVGGKTATCEVTVKEPGEGPGDGEDEGYTIVNVYDEEALFGVYFLFEITETDIESVTFCGFSKKLDSSNQVYFIVPYSFFNSAQEYNAIIADKELQKEFAKDNITLVPKQGMTEDDDIVTSATAKKLMGVLFLNVYLDTSMDLTGATVVANGTVILADQGGGFYKNSSINDFEDDAKEIAVRVELPAENTYCELIVQVTQ